MQFCPRTLKRLFNVNQDASPLPFHKFSSIEQSPINQYYNLSVLSKFGYICMAVFIIFANISTYPVHSQQFAVFVTLGYLVFVSPLLVGDISAQSPKVKDLVTIVGVLNFGMLFIPFFERILINAAFLLGLTLLRKYDLHFYSLQYAIGLISFSFCLLQEDIDTSFIKTNFLFIVCLTFATIFFSVCLISPTRTLVKNVYFYKDVSRFFLFLIGIQFVKMIEDVENQSFTLEDAMANFHKSFQNISLLIILIGMGISLSIKMLLFVHNDFDIISAMEEDSELEYVGCICFLMTEEVEYRIRDSFYLLALRKVSDYTLILAAVLLNLIFLEWPWVRLITNFAITHLYSSSGLSYFIKKLNLVVFASQFIGCVILNNAFIFMLEKLNNILSLNVVKATTLTWKMSPYTFDTLHVGFTRGFSSKVMPQHPTSWDTGVNIFILSIIVLPLCFLGYYLNTRHYQKHRLTIKPRLELILEVGIALILWILCYVPLFDSVFFLCISSFVTL